MSSRKPFKLPGSTTVERIDELLGLGNAPATHQQESTHTKAQAPPRRKAQQIDHQLVTAFRPIMTEQIALFRPLVTPSQEFTGHLLEELTTLAQKRLPWTTLRLPTTSWVGVRLLPFRSTQNICQLIQRREGISPQELGQHLLDNLVTKDEPVTTRVRRVTCRGLLQQFYPTIAVDHRPVDFDAFNIGTERTQLLRHIENRAELPEAIKVSRRGLLLGQLIGTRLPQGATSRIEQQVQNHFPSDMTLTFGPPELRVITPDCQPFADFIGKAVTHSA